MDKSYYQKIFSTERMQKYFDRYPDKEQLAITHYHCNIELSESFYPTISMLEVALRNSLNRELTDYFGTPDWYLKMKSEVGLRNLKNEIQTAEKHIINRGETITASKVIAELTLGFWVRLLNAEYERVLWKPLRKAFPYLEKSKRQRNIVSAPINKIRNFRNRIFHHEPICWNLGELEKMHTNIIMVMGWLNKDLPEIAKRNDRVAEVIKNCRLKLAEV
ncbi:Abi family protein [Flavobacterium sp. RNTU_13]|uniref:Abi family protein n=1 Tax=Flavobacterium sp. RNTU_13 TaxID=3375145 RepID=UPI00398753A0